MAITAQNVRKRNRRRAGHGREPDAGPAVATRLSQPAKPFPDPLAHQLSRMAILFHRRWSPAILAELLRGDTHPGGAKFITLVNRLHVSRDSLKATLDDLIEHDLVMRNPGYSHPMRPEYLLAETGYDIAPACGRLMSQLKSSGQEDVALRKWSMPILFAIQNGIERFGELRTLLPNITARALTLALKDLTVARLVQRYVIDGYPPTTLYRLTFKGRRLALLLKHF